MKLVSVADFHAMPVGTVFRIGEPWAFGPLSIKGASCPFAGEPYAHDWSELELGAIDADSSGDWGDKLEHALANPQDNHLPIDLFTEGRDGCFDDSRVVLVFEPADVVALIGRLQRALAGVDTYSAANNTQRKDR
jgi:hypothetical protein